MVGSEIYVTCHSGFPTSDGEVRVLDHNGVVKKTIGVNRDGSFMFKCPYFVTVNPATMKLFVSDYGSYLERPSTLFCLTWNGELVYKYQNPDLRNGRGLCINGDDIVMICGGHYHNVQVVRPEGTFHHTLLSSEEGLKKPCCIAVRKSDDTLVVGCWNSQYLLTFKLSSLNTSDLQITLCPIHCAICFLKLRLHCHGEMNLSGPQCCLVHHLNSTDDFHMLQIFNGID